MVCRHPAYKLLILLILAAPLSSQELVLQGKIRDTNTHRLITGVNVFVAELQIGTFSKTTGYFYLKILRPDPEMIVTFQHVNYDTLNLTIEDVLTRDYIELQERIIDVPIVEIESVEEQLDIENDLPQTISIIDSRVFDLRGYVDAGDLLRTDHSIQVDEELSGKKTVAIRGGNPDEVIVLYNGIKLNNALDNTFDISLIDLNDVERFEIIKGSNTSLYGPEAFSGVVNVIPRSQQDYQARFHQRIGSYNSGGWGLNLNHNFRKLYGSYSIKRGGSHRKLIEEPPGRQLLENLSEHQNASLAYNFSEAVTGKPVSSLGVMYNRSELDYRNERDNEAQSNLNQMISARYVGDIGKAARDVSISAAYQWLDESQFLRFFESPTDSGFLEREFGNRTWYFNATKKVRLPSLQMLLGYQFSNAEMTYQDHWIPFSDEPSALEYATLNRRQHGFTSINKLHLPTGSDFVQRADFDVSLRYDLVTDSPSERSFPTNLEDRYLYSAKTIPDNSWKNGTVKFSAHLSGNTGVSAFNGFVTVGNNIKFPSLMQQLSTTELLSQDSIYHQLSPERNRSMEVGMEYTRQAPQNRNVNGWSLSGSVFRNDYRNKFRSYFLPGTPIALYDNVPTAHLTGFETKQSLFLFNKKMTIELGASRYFFSQQNRFPFKHDRKYTFNILIDQAGYSLQMYTFKEGAQVAQIRNQSGAYEQLPVPDYTNIDLHFSKSFNLLKGKLILNASVRNLLDDDFELEGLTLRDRRFYITAGIEY